MSGIPETIKAVTATADRTVKVSQVPAPSLDGHPEDVIIKNYACAQNPTDWKSVAYGRTTEGNIVGNDIAGIVVAIGDSVKKVKVGERVATICAGAFIEKGTSAFAEYSRVASGRLIQIPQSMSFTEAATIPLAGLTAASGLYQLLGLPEPPQVPSDTSILVWAGSTSVGMFVIQMAALSGLQVVATASPQNFDLLKSFGAKYVFDYKSPTVIEDISKITSGRLQYIYDCHATEGSTQKAAQCLPGAGGKVVTLLYIDESTLGKNVQVLVPLLYKITGKEFPFAGKMMPASPEDEAWAEEWVVKLSKLLAEGKIKGNPVKVMGGLEGVQEGFKYMQEGKVRAQKLVYEIVKE